ncbi:MAG TPA: hypothetical protein VGF30_10105 [Bacteroidia bacterium]
MSFVQSALGTTKGINYTNIFLMIMSAALAFVFPFHLFLFVYAVLGPLHYLTEMSWLERRKFFIEKKGDAWLYLLMAILLTIPAFNPGVKIAQYGVTFLVTSVFFTLIIFFVKNSVFKYILTFIVFFASAKMGLDQHPDAFMWFGLLLPTIIHVCLFTGLFILYGALKTKSGSGYLSLGVFALCILSCFLFMPSAPAAPVSEHIQKTLVNFDVINRGLLLLFGLDSSVTDFNTAFQLAQINLFTSPAAIAVARFIAFAYTYHYLNWFSKTAVIKWHEVPKQRMIWVVLLWIGSVVAYLIDYNIGFKVLFLFSMMHVLLEFPLNFVTIRGIGTEIRSLLTTKK